MSDYPLNCAEKSNNSWLVDKILTFLSKKNVIYSSLISILSNSLMIFDTSCNGSTSLMIWVHDIDLFAFMTLY